MEKNNWKKLNHFQIGKFGEYFTKMEFTKEGFDVYTTEIDDKGIDFVVRKNEKEYFDIQVKSVRNNNYIFVRKDIFKPRKNLLLCVVLFQQGEDPVLLLMPSLDWVELKHKFLLERNYEGKCSSPEWGINITKSNLDEIKSHYLFSSQVNFLSTYHVS